MKYAIIKNNKVIQVQLDDKYKLSKTETIVETDKDVVCGQLFNEETGEFTNPVIVKTEEELAEEKKRANEKELVQKLGGDSQVNALAKFVNVFAEEFAIQNPESKTAGMLQIVKETLSQE